MKFQVLGSKLGYRKEHLWLPKSELTSQEIIKNSLTFPLGDGEVTAYSETDTHLVVPREYVPFEEWEDLDFRIVDRAFTRFPSVKVLCNAVPRDVIQREAHQALLESGNGIISLACGRGKTVVALMAWCDLEVPALIVVHTTDLAEQWKERILEFTSLSPEDIGLYQGKVETWQKPVTIAILKTLAIRTKAYELPDGFQEHFGVVIFDEVHNIGAPFFHECGALGRGFRWGLSATHERDDGLDALYKYHIGPVVYENLKQDIVPETYFIRLDTKIPGSALPDLRDRTGDINLAKLQTWLSEHPARNASIINTVQDAVDDGRTILALSNRVGQVDLMDETFGDLSSKIHGSVGKARSGALHRTNLVFATTALAKEGLDRKDLDTAMLLLPIAGEGIFRQVLGRIQRAADGKSVPVFIVFEDKNIKICVAMCRKLRRHLTSFGYPFHMVDP
tara:strand:+ start:318 stop:1664 length:1347 start_codon:yes stop_codon:yes gene_type:complete